MAVNLALLVWGYVKWRSPILQDSITGPVTIFLILAVAIMSFALIWDLRLKMWREQTSVLVEKNPYMKEKFAPKEIALNAMLWIPLMEKLGKDDPALAENARLLKEWLKREIREDKLTTKDLEDIMAYMGNESKDLFGLK
jgi:Na+/citrate or Na+/malate symporter